MTDTNSQITDESALVSFIGRKLHQALNGEDGDLSQERQDNLDRYLGKLYGTERDGYSSYVTREVLEAVEWAMPSIVRVFTSGDMVVSFDPVSMEDEYQAEVETKVINHLLLKENDGFETIYAWCKDALLYPNGYVKCWADESEEATTESYEGLVDVELADLMEDPEVEITDYGEDVATGPDGQPVSVYSVNLKRTTTKARIVFEAVPPEQVLVDNDLTSQNMDEADFVAHRVKRTRTWLLQNGYEASKLDMVGTGDNAEWNDERVNRLFHEDENPDTEDEDDPSMRQYWVHECYLRVDYDGDGIAERRRVVMIGDTIFENEEYGHQPFVSMSSVLMSHKHTGLSLADLVKDIQLISTTLTRQLLDNVYRQNIRRTFMGEGAMLEDGATVDAFTDTTAELIPVRDVSQILPETVQSIIPEIAPVLERLTDQSQMRSGVTPNLSLDPNVLQQSTAGAFSAALEQASERVELIARVFAETGMKRLMRKAHRLSREHMDHELQLKLCGKWVTVNPSDWKDRTTVTVNVGLGFNDKQTKIQLLAALLEYQERALPLGITDAAGIYHTLEEMIEAAGLGDPSKYIIDPSTVAPSPPQPDPLAEQLAMQTQIEAQKAKAQEEKDRADIMLRFKQQEDASAAKAAELNLKQQEQDRKVEEMALKMAQIQSQNELGFAKILADLEKMSAQMAQREMNEADQLAADYLAGE